MQNSSTYSLTATTSVGGEIYALYMLTPVSTIQSVRSANSSVEMLTPVSTINDARPDPSAPRLADSPAALLPFPGYISPQTAPMDGPLSGPADTSPVQVYHAHAQPALDPTSSFTIRLWKTIKKQLDPKLGGKKNRRHTGRKSCRMNTPISQNRRPPSPPNTPDTGDVKRARQVLAS